VASDNSRIKPTNDHLKGAGLTWTASVGGNENLPINGVNWWESYAFCIWDGGFLPSEAEWESAAAGGDQQRKISMGLDGAWIRQPVRDLRFRKTHS
jgi:formylglycine-generating enzyme required for sulfatase activity